LLVLRSVMHREQNSRERAERLLQELGKKMYCAIFHYAVIVRTGYRKDERS
jgi:hypothetical protein